MTKATSHSLNQREHMPEGIQVRYHDDGTVDEIVVRDRDGKCLLHMEQMADSRFWIGLYGYNDSSAYPVHVDIFTDGRMVRTDDEDDSEKGCQQIFARVRT
jgi:hypothetical protein